MEKTCGNCNLADFDLMRCDYFDDNGEHEAITKNKPACEDWIERVLTDEERYQQLAEVARELYKDLERVSDKRLERSKRENMLETHFNKLYDLGVEL